MPFDSRLTDPEEYIDDIQKRFYRNKKVDYGESFKKSSTQPPFTVNRFDASDLRRKIQTKKPILNPRLNFVNDSPEEFKLFTGLPRFDSNKKDLYNFAEGRPNTQTNFKQYPEYKPIWGELYNASPTVADPSTNPMPRASNPDPLGIIQTKVQAEVEAQMTDNFTVAELLGGKEEGLLSAGEKDKQT